MSIDQLKDAIASLARGDLSKRDIRAILKSAADEIERQQSERWSLQCDNYRLADENRKLSSRLLGLRRRVAELDRMEMEKCK